MQSPDLGDGSKKRRRGATRLSCAECRRLKLRCDRTVPCSSCVKRGCGAICPDGSLTTGLGNRFVLATTQELHLKINELCNRVRNLEDALRSAHSQLSPDPHPLLNEELLKLKHPMQKDESGAQPTNGHASPPTKEETPPGETVDSIGSLSVAESGRTKFYGNSANSYYFLHNESLEDVDLDDRIPRLRDVLPSQVLGMTGTFPTSLMSGPLVQVTKETLESLYWYLPNAEQAAHLRDTYFQYAAWMYNPIPFDQFNEEIYVPFYEIGPQSLDDPLLGHRLSVLFMVLAIGSQVDPALPAHNVDAEKYHQLARAALFGSRIVDQPTTRAVQSLYLMVFYQFLEDPFTSTSNARWAVMGLAVKLAQSIGLHRDSGRFQLDAKETQRRRDLFLELYVYDSWMALTLGRPPSISGAHCDIKLPAADDATIPLDRTYAAWKYRFTHECLSVMHDKAFGAQTPSYPAAMQLDRKLRAHAVPPVLQIAGYGGAPEQENLGGDTPGLILQRHTVVLIRESNLLYLHRGYFARAITDHPEDPLGSPYGTSVIAAYRSAWSLIALIRNLYATLKHPTDRLWFIWANLFSTCIILGSIVTKCPSLTLAPSALMQLDAACDLFSKVAPGFRAEKVLNVMLRLQEKAHLSLNNFRAGKTPGTNGQLKMIQSPVDDDVDELATLGGRTRVVTRHESQSPYTPILSPGAAPRVVPVPLYNGADSAQQLHPSVIDYLRTFAPSNYAAEATTSQATFTQPTVDTNVQGYDTMGLAVPQNGAAAYTNISPGGGAYPQYFPVFDYGPAGGEGAFPPMTSDNMVMSATSGSRSESPHSAWNTFVAQLGM